MPSMKLLTALLVALVSFGSRRNPSVRAAGAGRRFCAALLCAIFVLCAARPAAAHKNGTAAQGCSGCHSGGQPATVTITPDQTMISPGQMINLTISVSQTNGPVAGFYLQTNGFGTLSIVDSGTKLIGQGVTHTQPRTGSGGQTTFRV